MSLIAKGSVAPLGTIGDYESLVSDTLGVPFRVEKCGQIQRFSTNAKLFDKAG